MGGYEQAQHHAQRAVEQGRIAVIEEFAGNDTSNPIDRDYAGSEFTTHAEYNSWLAERFTEADLVATDSWLDAPPALWESALGDDISLELHAPATEEDLTGPARWPIPFTYLPPDEIHEIARRMKAARPDVEIEAVRTFTGGGNTDVAGEFSDSLRVFSPVYPNQAVTLTETTPLGYKDQSGLKKRQPVGHELRVETVNELTGESSSPVVSFRWAEHREASIDAAVEQVKKLPIPARTVTEAGQAEAQIHRQQLLNAAPQPHHSAGPELS